MKLYYSPGACSLGPHIALREAALKFDLEKVDLKAKRTESGADYSKINPKGYVPALQLDDGELLTEAAVVLQYIADRKPASGLAPAPATIERYRLMEWLNFISSEIHKGFGPLWNPQMPEEAKRLAVERLGTRFDYLAAALSGKTYLTGSQFTVADAYLFTVVNWTSVHHIDLARWPALKDYMARVARRPAVSEALQVEGLTK
jgi:glutathione S-transferase